MFGRQIEETDTIEMIRDTLGRSGKCAKIFPEAVGISIAKQTLHRAMGLLPDGNRSDKQVSPFWRERHPAAAAVRRVLRNVNQSAALQWLQSGR
jgi:hypothetical protein